MKKFRTEYVISGLFIAVIMFFMCSIGIRFVGTNIFHVSFEDSNIAETGEITEETIKIDWESLYPFDPNNRFEFETSEINEAQTVQQKQRLDDRVKQLESNVDYYSSNLLFGRMKFIEANALFNKTVGMKIISGTDSVIAMNNGYLTFRSYSYSAEYASASLEWFNEKLKEKGIGFMYVQFPTKESPYDNRLPVGVEEYNNSNADNIISGIKNNNIDYLDFRPLLNSKTDNWYGSFFRTDHHWLPETGVWAAGELAKNLNNRFNYKISESIGNIENYNVKIYENYCLGSQGRKTTLKFTDPEDISLITPKGMTDFTVRINTDKPKTGKFEDVLINMSVFEKIDYYNVSTYSAYMYGSNALVSIKNNNVHNGKRLLILSDSFCRCVVPYLAQSIEYIDVIDRRYFSGSVMNYIEQFSPDTVIVAYISTELATGTSHSGMFNFE